MNNYILLSNRKWNKELFTFFKEKYPKDSWTLINTKESFTLNTLKEIKPNKIFIPHWSYIIPKEIYEKYECIVFHMTDLPFGRGGSPLQNLIVRKIENTKISALKVEKEIDSGPVYLKSNLNLNGTAEEIFIRANAVIKKMIINILDENILPNKQEGKVTLFKRRTPEMSNVANISEIEILYDYIRMLDAEGYPKAFIETEHFRFEFDRANLKTDKSILADVRIIKK